jgi:DNA topoisomerase II
VTPTLAQVYIQMADQYKKHTHREHILELPDTYVGSTETHEEVRWIYDAATSKMAHRKVAFNPGFYKIFDEIIVNARDALVRSQGPGKQPIKHIEVSVNRTPEGLIVDVENDGDGIPIEMHPEHKVYAPELIFGHLLTSGNYDKTEEKIVGGKNGYGAKLTNIFSKKFTLSTRHPASGQKYTQVWQDHMATAGKPQITKDKATKGFVKITYEPDLARFPGLDLDAMLTVIHTRTIELAAMASKDVKVSWNGAVIPTNTFEKFINLFIRDGTSHAYERCGERWEIGAVLARNLFSEDDSPDDRHISFVNGINTRKGGKHVEAVLKVVLGGFTEAAKKKKVDIKPAQLKDSVVFFINSTIVNPSFDSQTKETLTTPATKFGSVFKCDKMPDTLIKIGLLEEAQAILDAKAAKDAKKTDGSKRKTLRGLPKLEDALWAGTAKSNECTLILTEGDSAAASAIAGLAVVGRERWGVFPLRGKMLNVKDISQEKFNKNEELTAIKKILGLEQGKVYTATTSLRYGRVMIMTDQDHDGSHIKGLLMNFFHTFWQSLLAKGFLCCLATPLLKVTKRGEVKSFYSQGEFEIWREAQAGATGWSVKYYKGLGTSTPQEAREWFKDLFDMKYEWDAGSDDAICLAFAKKRSDDRKEWLKTYDSRRTLAVVKGGKIPYTRFVHDELIHFSNADNLRSLPHVMDGLKPSQRKILYCCLKRGLRSEIKVAQLAGYVSEHASYHHGEASLNTTIVGMAQNFVGSNNVNLLIPNGQFGSRLMGGQDAAQPRYIHTQLEPVVDAMFRKEDAAILKHIDDDGLIVEPEYYQPVVPLLVINGAVGIGTGFSTNIPPHNPADVLSLLRDRLSLRRHTLAGLALQPWWYGFNGTVHRTADATWVTKGKATWDDVKHTITITELPVGTWTKDYKVYLDTLCTGDKDKGIKPILESFDDLYNDTEVKFILYFDQDTYFEMRTDATAADKMLQLNTTWHTTNMVCFSPEMKIKRYGTVGDMMEDYYQVRLKGYETRKDLELKRLERELIEYDAKARFLLALLEDRMDLRRKSDEAIVEALKAENLPALDSMEKPDSVDSYEYLLRMRMDRVKASAVEDARKHVEAARQALEVLRATTTENLWIRDLDVFEKTWASLRDTREAARTGTPLRKETKKVIKIKKAE